MKNEPTQYGFKFGPAHVERLMSDDVEGWIYIGISTAKHDQVVRVYVTKTGKTRVYKNGVELK